nr:bacterial Ig-like domain-containing protein [Cellulosimicrobium arenosum]
MADGGWTETDGTRHTDLQPYFATDIASGNFEVATDRWSPPSLQGDRRAPRASHGNVFALTAAEHAAFRGAELDSLALTSLPDRTTYEPGEALDTTGLEVEATYADGSTGVDVAEGFGGYTVSGYDRDAVGKQELVVSYTVGDVTRTTSFEVLVGEAGSIDLAVQASARCLAGRAYVAVRATNGEDVPVDVRLATPYGERTFADVGPGRNAYQSFAVRADSVPAGTVTVDGAATIAGEEVTTTSEVELDGLDCA